MSKEFFIKRYKQLGENFKEINLRHSLRVNTLKITDQEIKKRLQSIGVVLVKLIFSRTTPIL